MRAYKWHNMLLKPKTESCKLIKRDFFLPDDSVKAAEMMLKRLIITCTVWSVWALNTPSEDRLSIAPTKKYISLRASISIQDQAIGQKLEMPAQTPHGFC